MTTTHRQHTRVILQNHQFYFPHYQSGILTRGNKMKTGKSLKAISLLWTYWFFDTVVWMRVVMRKTVSSEVNIKWNGWSSMAHPDWFNMPRIYLGRLSCMRIVPFLAALSSIWLWAGRQFKVKVGTYGGTKCTVDGIVDVASRAHFSLLQVFTMTNEQIQWNVSIFAGLIVPDQVRCNFQNDANRPPSTAVRALEFR